MMASEDRITRVEKCIKTFPDFPKKGIYFKDIFPLLRNPVELANCIDLMVEHIQSLGVQVDVIIGLDARGFIFAPLIAQRLHCGFAPVRKAGKLPGPCVHVEYTLEYGKGTLEAQLDSASPGQKVIIVDDLLATGGTMQAACHLMKELKVDIVECIVLIELAFLNGRKRIPANVHSLIQYKEE